MNMIAAMRDTVALMDRGLQSIAEDGDAGGDERMHIARLDTSLQPQHIRDMLKVMESDENPQIPGEGFSDGKLGRWLGWAQAAVVAMGLTDLEAMKDLNRRHAD